MFTRLRTKLTVLYAGLFGGALLALSAIVYSAISENAARVVRSELQANGAVFDRVWALRESQLQDSADLLARDFGFRDAAASGDETTIQSALDNLRSRLQISRAFLIGLDGEVIGLGGVPEGAMAALWGALDAGGRPSGVLSIAGKPHQGVSAPILAPDLIGWVVFATELDHAHMRSFAALAAIPLDADVLVRTRSGGWRSTNPGAGEPDARAVASFLDGWNGQADNTPRRMRTPDGDAIALVKPLRSMQGGDEALLLLRYSLTLALRPYAPLLASIAALGLLSVGVLAFATWILARSLTRPIAALDEAVRALQSGRRTEVAVQTGDEIGRLAHSFNVMSGTIAERERRITHMALHDPETGLPNRRAFEDAIAGTDQGARATHVAVLSVDRYVQIRGAIGYGLVTGLMRELAAKAIDLKPGLMLARVGPDMIAVLFEARSDFEALRFAGALRAGLEGRLRVEDATVDVGLTAGIAAVRAPGDGAALERAAIAVEQARAGRRSDGAFDAGAYGDPARNLSLMSEMIDGLHRGDLVLNHQPKFDLRRGAVSGVEALTRWAHPTRGRIAPDLFVTMAEETGHIRALTEWTLIQAIGEQRRLRRAGHDLLMSVNLSGRLIDDHAFADMAINLIEDTGARLCLEITETAAMADPDAAIESIARYAAAGVEIAIDDYGAGLSSLSYLKRIPAHELKIDKSFIQTLAKGQREALLVKSTIDLAHGLGLKVTAEGVEDDPALTMLAAMGCDVAQGYLIARPMAVDPLIAWLANPPVQAGDRPALPAGSSAAG